MGQKRSQEHLRAVLILLAIRALGKSKELLRQLPKERRCHGTCHAPLI